LSGFPADSQSIRGWFSMSAVFDYTDYKAYLQRYFSEKKGKNPHFSYQLLARKAGFNNRGFIYNIIKGSRRISKSHCAKISSALGHDKNEAEYFKNIVAYAQAKGDDERSFFLEKALRIKFGKSAEALLVRKDQHEFYSKWYHSAVRSIVGMHRFKDDFERLGRKLSPAITAAKAEKSVRLLDRLGLIAKGKDGVYRITGKSLRVGGEIPPTVKNRFHGECTSLARKAITDGSPNSRSVISLTLGISRSTFEIIRREAHQFKNRVVELSANDENADTVYQCQFLMFPLSNDQRLE
jgi:uncharacterized protein (TIGR02147 family)